MSTEQKNKRINALKDEYRKWSRLRESTETISRLFGESATIGNAYEMLQQLELAVAVDLRGMGEPFPIVLI